MTPNSAEEAWREAAKGAGWPWRIRAGMRMAPTAKVVATLDPDRAAKTMLVRTQARASPPRTPPTRLLARSTRRVEMPPASMRLPARMKKGIATSGYLSRAA